MKKRTRGRVAGLAVGAIGVAMTAAMALPATASAAPAGTGPSSTAPARVVPPPKPPQRTLKYGLRGADVTALQQRLQALHYWVNVTGVFDYDTQEAVYAFQGVNGLPIDGVVGTATYKALASPRTWRAQDPGDPTRVEVDIKSNIQVLVFYKNGKIDLISHVSSGGGYYFCNPGGVSCGYAITPTGYYHAQTFMRGWITVPLGAMYNPVFFIGTVYAIHGDTSVPAKPASHGCVRIPDDLANSFYKLLDVQNLNGGAGTPIDIYNRGL
jgi:hypothetical protein